MTTETKRNLAADLAICAAAVIGEWSLRYGEHGEIDVYSPFTPVSVADDVWSEEDATFISEARTGWPDAIKQAMAAEEHAETYRKWWTNAAYARLEMGERIIGLEAEIECLRAQLPVTNEQAAETMRLERKVREILDTPDGDRRRRKLERQHNELTGGER